MHKRQPALSCDNLCNIVMKRKYHVLISWRPILILYPRNHTGVSRFVVFCCCYVPHLSRHTILKAIGKGITLIGTLNL